jgi:hypothetical protein
MFPIIAGAGMGLDMASTLDIGVYIGNPDGGPRTVAADPTREYVASAGVMDVDRGYFGIEQEYGGPLAWHGIREYERMYHTPIAGSAVDTVRYGVLANGVNLLPAVVSRHSAALGSKPGQEKGSNVEAEMAAEILESNRRLLKAWKTPVEAVLWETMEDLYLGHVMNEVIADDVSGGPDDGLLAIQSVKAKHRSTYQFRVDRGFNVIGVRCLVYDDKGATSMKLFEPDHFAWSTNEPHRGDPRGRSCYRKSHYHWKLLMDLWPEVWEGWRQFGRPWVYGNTAEGAKQVAPSGPNGKPIPGPGVTPEYAMAMTISKMRASNNVGVGPFGSTVKVVESTKDQTVAAGGISVLEGQIIRSIHLQLRATTEAKHGSKADSETGENVFGTVLRGQRMVRENWVRSLLIKQNTWNYGEDIAMRLTPLVDLGGTEHQDFAANSSGVGLLFQAGYFTQDMLPETDTFLGFTPRQIGDQRVGPTGVLSDTPAPEPGPTPAPEPAKEAA